MNTRIQSLELESGMNIYVQHSDTRFSISFDDKDSQSIFWFNTEDAEKFRTLLSNVRKAPTKHEEVLRDGLGFDV